MAVNAKTIEVRSLKCSNTELDIKAHNLVLEDVTGTVEVNCNLDMNIICYTLNGSVEINQISATSRIRVPEKASFTAIAKGIRTSISYEKDGKKLRISVLPVQIM